MEDARENSVAAVNRQFLKYVDADEACTVVSNVELTAWYRRFSFVLVIENDDVFKMDELLNTERDGMLKPDEDADFMTTLSKVCPPARAGDSNRLVIKEFMEQFVALIP